MTADSEADQPSLPPGTYCIAVMLIGADRMHGQSLRLHWPHPMRPSQLASVAGANAAGLVPDELAGAQPGMWWLFQVFMADAWGRTAVMSEQVAVDRTLDRDELAGELARVAPQAMTVLGEGLVKFLTAIKPRAAVAPAADAPRVLN